MNIRFTNRAQQPPDVSQGLKVPYAPGKRVVTQWRWWLILALVTSPFLYLLYQMVLPMFVATAPGVITLERETLVAVTESTVERVHVQVGDKVKQSQVVAELVAPRLDEQIDALSRIIEPANTNGAAPAGAGVERHNTFTLYRQQEQYAAQAVAHQEGRLAIVSRLFAQGSATVAEVNAVRAQLDAARHTLIQAQLARAAAEQQAATAVAPPKLQVSAQPLQQLQQQLALLRQQRQQLTLRSSYDGTVLEILADRGTALNPGAGVLVVGQQSKSHILAYLPAGQLQWVDAGVQATVSVSGGPSLQAKVREKPSQARRLPAELSSAIGSRDIMVVVTLDPIEPLPPERAIEGLPVNVRFHRNW